MSSRILIANGSIARGGYYGSVANNHGPDRDLVSLHRFTRDIESVADVLLVRGQRARAQRCLGDAAICPQAPALSTSGR